MPEPRFVRFLALAAAAAPLALAAGAARADRVDTFAPLGRTVGAEVDAAGDVATVGFVIPEGAGRKLSILVKPAKKSPLALDVRLVGPDGAVVDPSAAGGSVKASTKLVSIVLPDVPAGKSGLWRVEVRGADGTSGGCTVTVKAKDGTSVARGETVPAGGSISVPLPAGSNQALTLTVRRGKGAQLTPRVRILDPYGNPLSGGDFLGVSNSKSGVLTLKAYRLPVFGTYTLSISGVNNTGGAVTYAAKTAPAKPPKNVSVASAGLPTETEPGMRRALDGTGSQAANGGQLSFLWTQVAGPDVDMTGADTATPSFLSPSGGVPLAFELAVAENGIWSPPAQVSVEVGRRPLADAGRSVAVATGANVALDGGRSRDRRGTGLRYAWEQDPADAVQVALTGADTATPSFTAPNTPTVLHFGLVVDDGALRSFEDRVTVRVGDTAQPTADAGRGQVVPRMATVHLSAAATLSSSLLLSTPFTWTQVSGPQVQLDNPASPFPAFTAPKQPADLLFEVSAGGATAAKDRVWVHVRPDEPNLAPLTRGNGVIFTAGGTVTLNASASADSNAGDVLAYRWAQASGPALAPSAVDIVNPTVTVPAGNAARSYAVQASDGLAYGPPDFVHVRNSGYSGDPVASAGADQTVQAGQVVTLDGRGSSRTQGTGPITYRWRQVSARDWFDVDAVSPTFDPAAALTTFTLPTDVSSLTPRRTLTFELVVNDGTTDSAPDYVTVTFLNLPLNGKPVVTASANPSNPLGGQLVTLQGTATDRDGDPVTVRWTQKSGTPVALGGGGATTLTPTFTAPASGTLVFELVANDGIENGVPVQTSVTVDAAPTARFTVTPSSGAAGTAITVDASQSSDPASQPLTYTWTQVSGPTVAARPTDTTTSVWAFNAPAQSVTFQLVVNDGRQNSQPFTGGFQVGVPITVAPSASATNAPYGATVTLNANTVSGGTVTYTWAQVTTGAQANDPAVTLSGASSASPTFTVPSPGTSTGFGATPSATFEVTANNGSNTAKGTVKVTFFASFNNAATNQTTTPKTVYGIIQGSCMGSSCHSSTTTGARCSTATGYGMGSASAFRSNNINAASCIGSNLRVDTTNGSGSSSLVDRMKGVGGTLMPKGGGSLPGSDIGLIADWIDQGALDN